MLNFNSLFSVLVTSSLLAAFTQPVLAQQQQARPPAPQRQATPTPPPAGQDQRLQQQRQGQGAGPGQQQAVPQPQIIRDGVTTERFADWTLEIFRRDGDVIWARAFVRQHEPQIEFALLWRMGAGLHPKVELSVPETLLRNTRDRISQAGSNAALELRILGQGSQHRIALSDLSFEGNRKIVRESSEITGLELMEMLKQSTTTTTIRLWLRPQEGQVEELVVASVSTAGGRAMLQRLEELTP